MNPNKVKLEQAMRERARFLHEMNNLESKLDLLAVAKNKSIDEVEQRMRKEVSMIKSTFVKSVESVKREQKQTQKALRKIGMDIMKIEHDIRQDKK